MLPFINKQRYGAALGESSAPDALHTDAEAANGQAWFSVLSANVDK